MTQDDVHSGLVALLQEALAVAMGEIDESEMTMPTELEGLAEVTTLDMTLNSVALLPKIIIAFEDGNQYLVTLSRHHVQKGY